MKIIKSTPIKGKLGAVSLTVHTQPSDETVLAIQRQAMYRLPPPLDDMVIDAAFLLNADEVHWCSVEQKWKAYNE